MMVVKRARHVKRVRSRGASDARAAGFNDAQEERQCFNQ